jgi:hypothetical protein
MGIISSIGGWGRGGVRNAGITHHACPAKSRSIFAYGFTVWQQAFVVFGEGIGGIILSHLASFVQYIQI